MKNLLIFAVLTMVFILSACADGNGVVISDGAQSEITHDIETEVTFEPETAQITESEMESEMEMISET
jgi:predicted small secreted protein